MEFKNKQNEYLILPDGREVWLSRSVAVVGIVCLIKNNEAYFLISKRGKGSSDYQGLYNLTCGYLDFNESSVEAFIREVYEECGLDITPYMVDTTEENNTPWYISTSPLENRQNVSITHYIIHSVDELPETKIMNIVEADEVEEILWIRYEEICNYKFAFNHDVKLKKFCSKFLGL